jgi:uncharacterized membrane protein YgcG
MVILADQSFPAVLPAQDGLCPIIIRVEDATLPDLCEVYLDRFRAHSAPHGALPPGSVIAIGSLTHMQVRGVADYAESFVSANFRLSEKVGPSVDIAPLIWLPLNGVNNPGLIRDMFDFDCWLLSGQQPVSTIFQEARAAFWKKVKEVGKVSIGGDRSVRALMLPLNLKNNRKKPFISEPPSDPLPPTLRPFTSQDESDLIYPMLLNANEVYGLGLDAQPDLNRDLDPAPGLTMGRMVLIGASHMRRTAVALESAGVEVIDLSTPGWTPTSENIASLTLQLNGVKIQPTDTVFLDLMSNTAYMGSDEMGIPVRPVRLPSDNRYHITGELQVAPVMAFKKVLSDCEPVLKAAGAANCLLVVPFPRYVHEKCCNDAAHIVNYGTENYFAEISRVEQVVKSAMTGLVGKGTKLFSLLGNDSDTDLYQMVTGGGGLSDIWNDPVHFTRRVYKSVADSFLAIHSEAGAAGLPHKRPRLDSVATPAPVARSAARVALPNWLLGRASRGRGTGDGGSGRGGFRGRGGNGGGGRGGYRGAGLSGSRFRGQSVYRRPRGRLGRWSN